MTMDFHCAIKRKAEEGTDGMCSCTTKRKIEQKFPPPVRASSEGHGGGGDVEVPERQMTRLPQEEIDRILSRTKHGPFPNPDDREPNPFRTPEDLEEARELFRSMTESCESSWASFSKFQTWVRSEFAAKGFVEVDDSFLAERAQNRAEFEEEWAAMLEELDLSDLIIGEDDDDLVIGDDDEYVGA
uniref:Uncharacterized protein n=1 Tax=Avena sativa TaxID=4498 RepID=A0ACD5V3D8_AVESA